VFIEAAIDALAYPMLLGLTRGAAAGRAAARGKRRLRWPRGSMVCGFWAWSWRSSLSFLRRACSH